MVSYAWIYIAVSVFKVKISTFLYSSLWSQFTKQTPDESGLCSTVAGRRKQSYSGEMEEGMTMQHKTVKKEAERVRRAYVEPTADILVPCNHLEDIKFGLTTIAK